MSTGNTVIDKPLAAGRTAIAPPGAATIRSQPLPALRRRIMASVMALSVGIWLLLTIGMIINARYATHAEVAASFTIAERFAEERLNTLGAAGTLDDYETLARQLGEMRHVGAALAHPQARPEPADESIVPALDDDDDAEAPRWFAGLIHQPPVEALFTARLDDGSTATLELYSNDEDEIAEVWQDFSFILPVTMLYGGVIALLSVLIVNLVFSRMRKIESALAELRHGHLETRLPPAEFRELEPVTSGFNDLASHLTQERQLNRSLARRLLDAHEAERRSLANDLHDEMGPHLFSLRAAVAMLKRQVAKPETIGTPAVLEEPLRLVEDEVATIQSATRRLVSGLRPMSVGGVPLRETIEQAIETYRRSAPETLIECRVSTAEATFGEVMDLTVYRFVQESILNALKHGGARNIMVHVRLVPGEWAGDDTLLEAIVTNDGGEPAARNRDGYGLIGIAERVEALGGTATPPYVKQGKTECRIVIPVRPEFSPTEDEQE